MRISGAGRRDIRSTTPPRVAPGVGLLVLPPYPPSSPHLLLKPSPLGRLLCSCEFVRPCMHARLCVCGRVCIHVSSRHYLSVRSQVAFRRPHLVHDRSRPHSRPPEGVRAHPDLVRTRTTAVSPEPSRPLRVSCVSACMWCMCLCACVWGGDVASPHPRNRCSRSRPPLPQADTAIPGVPAPPRTRRMPRRVLTASSVAARAARLSTHVPASGRRVVNFSPQTSDAEPMLCCAPPLVPRPPSSIVLETPLNLGPNFVPVLL